MTRTSILTLSCTLALLACDDLELRDDDAQLTSDAAAAAPSAVSEEPRTATVDSSKDDVWVFLDLESGQTQVAPQAGPEFAWDIALQRFKVMLNAPVSGSGNARASVLTGADFSALVEAPTSGYGADLPDGSDDDNDPEYLLSTGASSWWAYDAMTHKLSPQPNVYVVRSTEGNYFKLAFTNYYNEAGSSGYPTLHWAKLRAPSTAIEERDAATQVDTTTSASTTVPVGADAGS